MSIKGQWSRDLGNGTLTATYAADGSVGFGFSDGVRSFAWSLDKTTAQEFATFIGEEPTEEQLQEWQAAQPPALAVVDGPPPPTNPPNAPEGGVGGVAVAPATTAATGTDTSSATGADTSSVSASDARFADVEARFDELDGKIDQLLAALAPAKA